MNALTINAVRIQFDPLTSRSVELAQLEAWVGIILLTFPEPVGEYATAALLRMDEQL